MRFDSPAADRVTAAILFALGAGMSYGGYVMDRLEIRQIHPASIPGLVPIILGLVLMLCAVLLANGTRRSTPQEASAPAATTEDGQSFSNFAFTALWCGVYALGMVGRMPFWAATAIFIFGFSGWFLIPAVQGSSRLRHAVLLVLFAGIMAVSISALFRYGFLVRLP